MIKKPLKKGFFYVFFYINYFLWKKYFYTISITLFLCIVMLKSAWKHCKYNVFGTFLMCIFVLIYNICPIVVLFSRFNTCSNVSAAAISASSRAWTYLFVVDKLECPRRLETVLISVPFLSNTVADVCPYDIIKTNQKTQ